MPSPPDSYAPHHEHRASIVPPVSTLVWRRRRQEESERTHGSTLLASSSSPSHSTRVYYSPGPSHRQRPRSAHASAPRAPATTRRTAVYEPSEEDDRVTRKRTNRRRWNPDREGEDEDDDVEGQERRENRNEMMDDEEQGSEFSEHDNEEGEDSDICPASGGPHRFVSGFCARCRVGILDSKQLARSSARRSNSRSRRRGESPLHRKSPSASLAASQQPHNRHVEPRKRPWSAAPRYQSAAPRQAVSSTPTARSRSREGRRSGLDDDDSYDDDEEHCSLRPGGTGPHSYDRFGFCMLCDTQQKKRRTREEEPRPGSGNYSSVERREPCPARMGGPHVWDDQGICQRCWLGKTPDVWGDDEEDEEDGREVPYDYNNIADNWQGGGGDEQETSEPAAPVAVVPTTRPSGSTPLPDEQVYLVVRPQSATPLTASNSSRRGVSAERGGAAAAMVAVIPTGPCKSGHVYHDGRCARCGQEEATASAAGSNKRDSVSKTEVSSGPMTEQCPASFDGVHEFYLGRCLNCRQRKPANNPPEESGDSAPVKEGETKDSVNASAYDTDRPTAWWGPQTAQSSQASPPIASQSSPREAQAKPTTPPADSGAVNAAVVAASATELHESHVQAILNPEAPETQVQLWSALLGRKVLSSFL